MRSTFKLFDVLAPSFAAASSSSSNAASSAAGCVSGATLVRRRAGLRPLAGAEHRIAFVPLTKPNPGRILNPFQRLMDEAVWRAFIARDFGGVFAIIREHGMDVNYQRVQSDLTTALMAAAYHGETKVAAALIRSGALVRVTDASGNTALTIALSRGHSGCAALLKDVLHEEEEELAEWAQASAGAAAVKRSPLGAGVGVSGASSSTAAASTSSSSSSYEYDVYMLVDEDEDGGDAEGNGTVSSATSSSAAPSSSYSSPSIVGAGGRVTQLWVDPAAYSQLEGTVTAAGGDGDEEDIELVLGEGDDDE